MQILTASINEIQGLSSQKIKKRKKKKNHITYDLFEKIDIFLLFNGVSVADLQNSFIDILCFVTILLDAPNESRNFPN